MTREEALKISDKKFKKMMTDYQEYLEHSGEPLKEHEKWLQALNMAIEALRQDERPKGRWVRISDRPKTYIRRCSNCNRDSYTCFSEKDYDFCPWCGADMRGEEE